jgi:signal transduction histidine kinase
MHGAAREMSPMTARRTADAVCVLAALLVVGSFLLVWGRTLTGQDSADWIYFAFSALGAGIYLAIGRAIVSRQPMNTIGWLLMAIPALALIALTNGGYSTRALVVDPGSLPFGVAAAWVDRWILVPALSIFIPLFLLFPDGHLPSRRWLPVGVVTFAAPVLTTIAFAVTPGHLTGAMSDISSANVTNPLGIDALVGTIDALTQVGGFLILASAVAAAVALAVRYRGADAEVRQQVRLLAFVGVAFFAELFIGAVLVPTVFGNNDALGNVVFMLLFLTLVLGIPIACGVAILRYHLYDLSVVVRKTVVWAVLAGFVTVVYAGVVAALSELVGGDSLVLSIVATGIVAALFQPVRRRATRLADRLVFGRRAEPYEVLSRFSERMGGTYAAEDVLPRMARVIAEATGAERVELWLRAGDALHAAASWPGDAEAIGDADQIVPIRYQERGLGEIRIRKSAAEPLTSAEEKLLDDLASQASVVVRNVGLTSDLQERVDELSLRADELRASRARIVAANDAERRRLERNIHDGAQQHLVALAVKLRLAEALAVKGDPQQAARMLRGLRDQTDLARETLLDLASGIYPATLEDRGIAAALEEQARAAGAPVAVDADGFERLSIETEAAVYFVCLEAMQNAQKYARASHVDVRLALDDGHLAFEVTDDGVGFDGSAVAGSGLQNMRDRLSALGGEVEISSAPGKGTTVRGRVPFREDALT